MLEYNEIAGDGKTFGNNREGEVASANINSGMFASFIDMKDVMGVFAGHDHDNDYLGINKGIVLGYGRVTGADAYGELTRGARIIELYEGKFRFDTWITTPSGREATYYYPSGLNSEEERTADYLPAVKNVSSPKQGVAYTYYEGKCKRVAGIASCLKVKEGVMKNISIKEAAVADHFAYDFHTLIQIPEKEYTVSIHSRMTVQCFILTVNWLLITTVDIVPAAPKEKLLLKKVFMSCIYCILRITWGRNWK